MIRKLISKLFTRKSYSELDLVFNLFSELPCKDGRERILVDVGAHFGLSMLKFARNGWKVYCFEPDDNNRSVLEKTIRNNNLRNVYVDDRAVSDSEGKASFYASNISTGISSLIKFHPSHKEVVEVETVALSSFFRSNIITDIDFLKIDTEGNDLKVIKGADIAHYRPLVILCEYEDAKTKLAGYTKEDMTRYLEDAGYKFVVSEWYPIVEYGMKHKWNRLTDDISKVDTNSWGNIIATVPELFALLANKTIKKLN